LKKMKVKTLFSETGWSRRKRPKSRERKAFQKNSREKIRGERTKKELNARRDVEHSQ